MISNTLALALNIPLAKTGHLSQLCSSEFLAHTQPTCWWGGEAIVGKRLDAVHALFSNKQNISALLTPSVAPSQPNTVKPC